MEKSNQWSLKSNFKLIIPLFIFQILNCYPADPDFKTKPLKNYKYSGFISRDFFQVVIEVKSPDKELTIDQERNYCKDRSIIERDKQTIPLLVKESSSQKVNEKRFKYDSEFKSDKKEFPTFINDESDWRKSSNLYLEDSEDSSLSRGEYTWFLDSMFLFREDYSESGKCKFIYRNIQEGLYEKVITTKLVVPAKGLEPKKIDPNDPDQKNSATGGAKTSGTTSRGNKK